MSTALTVVTQSSAGQRAKAAQDAARCAAAEHVEELLVAMRAARVLALEVAGAGDPYPAGIRAAAEQFAKAAGAADDTIVTVGSR